MIKKENNSQILKKRYKAISNEDKRVPKKKKKNKIFTKQNILFFFIPIIIFINLYLFNNNPIILELNKKVKELESKIKSMEKEVVTKKIKIGIINQHLLLNGIGRFITVLAELLVKTGKYDVYLITEQQSDYDFKYNKKIKRHIVQKEFNALKDFDEENDIQIYIINNDLSSIVDFFHSFGKKVIGIFHGVYLSLVFQNKTEIYRSWKLFSTFDSFVHNIPDDYWVYKKFGINNSIYIPNVFTFESKNTPSAPLTYKNLLMVARLDDVIKGGKYAMLAMAEIIKEVPDALLTIIGTDTHFIENLVKEFNIEKNVYYPGFSTNVTEFYLNASVLLVTSLSESYPMVMNEAKAYGLPIVAFNVDYCPCYQSGVITVEMFNYKEMAKEAVKLLKNYEYRKKKGEEAKLSLNNFETNNEKIEMWDKLFNAILNSTEDYNKLQREIENKYYNETAAKEHLKKHYHYGQKFNKYFRCHSFEKFTDLNYINNINVCKIN